MTMIVFSPEDIKKIVDGVLQETKDRTDISDLSKFHVIDALYAVLYRINDMEAALIQKELNKTFDRLLFREGEEK